MSGSETVTEGIRVKVRSFYVPERSAPQRDLYFFAYRVTISNEGPPIPDEHMDRLFDPFFTTKPIGEGMGLGLSVCAGIVSRYRGTIAAANEPGRVTFEVRLPTTAVNSKSCESTTEALDELPDAEENRGLLCDSTKTSA